MDKVKTMKRSESCYSSSNSREQDKILLQPYLCFTQSNETRIQTNFQEALRAFNFWMKIPEDKVSLIENIIVIIKETAMLFDTFKDDAIVDKERATVHSIYGISSTINAAGCSIVIAMEKALLFGDNKILEIFILHVKELYKGLMQEYEWSNRPDRCPEEEECTKVCVSKMGSYFKAAAQVMQYLGENEQNFVNLCEILGVFFSLYEDFVFLRSEEGSFGNLYYDYVSSRKFNFPIIHAFRNQMDITLPGTHFNCQFKDFGGVVVAIFLRKTNNINVKKYFVTSLEEKGSFDYTKQVLLNLKMKAEDEIKNVGGNPPLLRTLKNILLELNVEQ